MRSQTQGELSEADIRFDMTVNEVIRAKPRTVGVFARLGIDACCGGTLSLAEAARRHRIDYIVLLAELEVA